MSPHRKARRVPIAQLETDRRAITREEYRSARRAARLLAWLQEEGSHRCEGCGAAVDPTVCYCGDARDAHRWITDHPFIPIGCNCHRDLNDKEIRP